MTDGGETKKEDDLATQDRMVAKERSGYGNKGPSPSRCRIEEIDISALCAQKGSTTWQQNGLSSKRFLWQFSSHAHVDTFLQREDQDLTPLLTIPKQGIRRISSSHLLTTFGENFHFDLVAVLYAY